MNQIYVIVNDDKRINRRNDDPLKINKALVGLMAVLLFTISLQVRAQESVAESLAVMMEKRPGWDNEVSEVAYVGTRCGALFNAVGGYFTRSENGPEDKESGRRLIQRASTFTEASMLLGRIAKMPINSTLERSLSIQKQYIAIMVGNKRDLNNALHTPVADDLEFCAAKQHNYDYVMEMARKAKK